MLETDSLFEKAELLTDEYVKQILAGCYQEPMSAQHISCNYSIPIAAIYRRLKELEEADLIEEVDDPKEENNKAAKYRTALEKAVLIFE